MSKYELHITVPTVPRSVMTAIFAGLAAAGFSKNKFFYGVHDIRPEDTACHSAETPPTGHDLRDPGVMSTVKVDSYREARQLLLGGMEVLARHNARGNFEVEGLIGPTTAEFPAIDIAADFPGFESVPKSPIFENHIIWKGTRRELPSIDQIVQFVEAEVGITPHQIVDFGRDWVETPETAVSRVATVYQPSRQAVIRFASILPSAKNTRLEYRYAVGEQVVLVGRPLLLGK